MNIISILVPIIICFLSQQYFVAFFGAIGIVVFIHFCFNFKTDRFLYFKKYLFLAIAGLIGTIIYLFNLGYKSVENSISIITFFINFIKGTLLMFGSSLWHSLSVYPLFGINKWMYILGILIAILYIFAILIYFREKIYQKTYIPLFLIFYCFISIVMVYYGRAYSFDLYYLTASRYTCETTLGLIGILWIFASVALNSKNSIKYSKTTKILASLSIVIIAGGLICASLSERNIGVYRGKGFENAKNIMKEINTVSDEELYIFQNTPSRIRSGVSLLEKYNLSVFNNPDKRNISQNSIKFNGFYERESTGVWINGNANIIIENKDAVHFSLTGYYPEHMPINQFTVTINNNESLTVEMTPGNTYNIEMDFENNKDIIYINLKTEKTFIPEKEGWNNDNRKLGAYITSWELSE